MPKRKSQELKKKTKHFARNWFAVCRLQLANIQIQNIQIQNIQIQNTKIQIQNTEQLVCRVPCAIGKRECATDLRFALPPGHNIQLQNTYTKIQI